MMTHLHVFTEEPSAKKVFDAILPKMLPEEVSFSVYSHQGKQDLEKALRSTVPSISRIPGASQDSGDCESVKQRLLDILNKDCKSPFLVRIACRELEAWFLGDLDAIKNAYPRFIPAHYAGKSEFRNVDNIQNVSQYLRSIIPEYKDREKLPKLETAEKISPWLDLNVSTSTSFRHVISGVKKLVE